MEMSREQRMAFELPSLPDSWWDLEEPPVQLRQTLHVSFLVPVSSLSEIL